MFNFSIPAFLSNFSTAEDNRTYADLKIFYKGETCDGRIFDDAFASNIEQSLPYTPVVAFYSDLKDDFIGHNNVQYIYGLVPHDANIRYETDEEGKEWLVTSVMLYTDRIDNIGEVAKKIVGKQHSLELDPTTVKYETFYKDGKLKTRFLEGRFIGLSVLGDNEKPAFTGSEFFTANTDFSELHEKFENFFSFLQNDRGARMKLEQFNALAEFVKLSYSQKMEKCQNELRKQLDDFIGCYVADMYDDKFVASLYNYDTGEDYYNFYFYTFDDNGEVSLRDGGKAFRTFVTAEELEVINNLSDYVCDPKKSKETECEEPKKTEETECKEETKKTECEEPKKTECAEKQKECNSEVTEEKKKEESNCVEKPKESECKCPTKEEDFDSEDKDDPEDKEDDDFASSAEKENPKVGCKEDKESTEEQPKDEENAKDKKQSTCTALSDSERQELEAFRKEKKQNLIDSFKGSLDDTVLNVFNANIDNYDYNNLEVALALEFTKLNKNRQPQQTQTLPFSFGTMFATPVEKQNKSYEDLIRERVKK